MIYSFERLIRKYLTNADVIDEESGSYNEETGLYEKTESSPRIIEVAVIPLPSRLVYQSAGRLTEADKQIYSLNKIKEKTKIKYKGMTYSVEQSNDFTEYGDFYQYVGKAVSVFD